jgi:ribosomal protein S18 acetylase RimI-like enzyme
MITIRPYAPENEATCMAIFDSNLPKYFTQAERDLFLNYLRRKDIVYFVAEHRDEVTGCAGYWIDDYGLAHLVWGMVHSARHLQGIGAALLKWRFERIRQTPYAWCVLINTSQHTAPFFARYGFQAIRTIPDGYQAGLDKIFMRATLPDRV